MKYGLVGKFKTQPGKQGELVSILMQAADLLQRNQDCIHYLVSTTEEPDAVWVTETWTNKEAHEASLAPADVRALIAQAMPLIAGMSDRTEMQLIGGKGL